MELRVRDNSSPFGAPRVAANQDSAALGRRHKADYWLVAFVFILLAVGLIVIYSISPALSAVAHTNGNYYVTKQLVAIGLGLVAFGVAANLPLTRWRQFAVPLLGLAAAATLLAIVMPVNPNYPAHRWVRLGSFSFQSVELLKFALLVWLAGLLHDRVHEGRIVNIQELVKPLLIALGVVGVVVVGIQSDLGSMGVIIAIFAAMLFVAGVPMKRMMMVAGIVAIGLILSISAIPYRRARLMAFLHPSADCQDSGYQACQALIAVGSGGMAGLGLGSSVQAYGYLPEAANDSIFAIYAEKFGFIGSVALLGVLAALFARIRSIAERTQDDFNRLLVVGIFSWLSVQSIINVGAMIGLLPLKGITLPFISYGGTSVIFALAAVGLVFQVSHYTAYDRMRHTKSRGATYDNRPDGRRVRGAYHPRSGNR